MPPPPITGFLQVDVDGLWAVRACYGRPEDDSYQSDPCWAEGLPRLRDTFGAIGVPASFFLVGRDLEHPEKAAMATLLHRQGYELGNHSFSHRLGMTLQPYGLILEELQKTDRLIRSTGADPVGFRAPGYDVDARVLRVVRRLRYLYDASILPTYLGPAFRVVDAYLARRWDPKKRQFGRFAYGRAPRRPYFPRRHAIRKPGRSFAETNLLEIPVGITPRWHLPLTATSLFGKSRRDLRALFSGIANRRRPTLLLLHAIDGVDCSRPIVFGNRRPALGGFALSASDKQKYLMRIVEEFARAFHVVRADEYARERCR